MFNKKNTKIFLLPFFLFGASFLAAPTLYAANENSCAISWGPIKEFSEYQTALNATLSKMVSESKNNSANCNKNLEQASMIFDAAQADISAMWWFMSDFNYNIKYAMKGDRNTAVSRDIKIFDQLEKRVENTATQLANSCGFSGWNGEKLVAIAKEIYLLKQLYQQTALGNAPTDFSGISGDKGRNLAAAITQAYSPSQTISCSNNQTKSQKPFSETLKNAFNFWAKKEDALSTWRKAIALIRGGGKWMSATEYAAKQRALLAAELSRQGLSSNAKNVILKNFDCYKAETSLSNGTPEDILSARAKCLSSPIAGAEKIFEAGENFWNTIKSWKNFVWSAKTSDDVIERENEKNKRKSRTFTVINTYMDLNSLVKSDQDDNANMMKNLVDWHLSLQSTNELLEKRIAPMQRNCMKWQPDIVGGCKS